MIIVDTSAWIFFFDERKGGSEAECLSQFLQKCPYKLLTTDLIIEETHKWLVHHSYNPKRAAEILDQFNQGLLAQIIPIEKVDRMHAVQIVKKYVDQKLSYTDALTVAMLKRMKLKQVCTFDSHFDLFPGVERVPRLKPKNGD